MKKLGRISLLIVALFVLVFIVFRYGWRFFGFKMCEDAIVDEITVEDTKVTLHGTYPGSFPNFYVGNHYEVEDGKVYIGLKYNNLLGVSLTDTGDYFISIDAKEKITAVYLKYGDVSRTIWKEGCSNDKTPISNESNGSEQTPGASEDVQTPEPTPTDIGLKSRIDPNGMTLETRILTPEGYTRTKEKKDSLAAFLRGYEMKEDQSEVLLYDGSLKANQNAHAAIFKLPIENRNLQQCADSIMRVYAEYYWSHKEYDKISFHFTNGFNAPYKKWQNGYRIRVSGNDVKWVKSASFDDSYDTFKAYLKTVFCYAGTMSMSRECKPIKLDELQVGDVFLKGGSPGHVVMVVDLCESADGKKAFLLAQGYMPAQEFHVLKNESHEEDPWYYEDEVEYPFRTPQYTFDEGSLQHPEY